jgi:hypothetical protein
MNKFDGELVITLTEQVGYSSDLVVHGFEAYRSLLRFGLG